jgi:hypothetical protein
MMDKIVRNGGVGGVGVFECCGIGIEERYDQVNGYC